MPRQFSFQGPLGESLANQGGYVLVEAVENLPAREFSRTLGQKGFQVERRSMTLISSPILSGIFFQLNPFWLPGEAKPLVKGKHGAIVDRSAGPDDRLPICLGVCDPA
jgi:hypothetical protein